MREFNLEEAKKGAKVCTRCGLEARIISWENSHNVIYPISANIKLTQNKIINECYTKKGQCIHLYEEPTDMDLMMED